MRRYILGITILAMSCWMLRADTITGKQNVSVNGQVLKMANGEITLVASYESKKKTLTIKKADAAIIEFNHTTTNSQEPKRAVGLGPPLKGSQPAATSEVPGTIVLWVGMRHLACNLIGIDEQWVHCAGKGGNYSRDEVLRIILANTK